MIHFVHVVSTTPLEKHLLKSLCKTLLNVGLLGFLYFAMISRFYFNHLFSPVCSYRPLCSWSNVFLLSMNLIRHWRFLESDSLPSMDFSATQTLFHSCVRLSVHHDSLIRRILLFFLTRKTFKTLHSLNFPSFRFSIHSKNYYKFDQFQKNWHFALLMMKLFFSVNVLLNMSLRIL